MDFVNIYIMDKEYSVPENATIMKAMEYSGYKFIRGCGCRAGICGACATVYRTEGDYRIKVGLACQTLIEPNMNLTQIPFFPANKSVYNIDELKPDSTSVLRMYPENARCLSCGTCNKICPQDLEVMEYVQTALRGDIQQAAELSFECIMCGLCASRCPAEIVQYNIGILCRRLYGKHMQKVSEQLKHMVEDIRNGKFDDEIKIMVESSKEDLKEKYVSRDIEPI